MNEQTQKQAADAVIEKLPEVWAALVDEAVRLGWLQSISGVVMVVTGFSLLWPLRKVEDPLDAPVWQVCTGGVLLLVGVILTLGGISRLAAPSIAILEGMR
jgi:predicted phage tail protein